MLLGSYTTSVTREHAMRRKGFTLIEMLVVCAIMSVIAGILFPAFSATREAGRRTACLSNSHQLTCALLLYAQDYDEVLCPVNTGSVDGSHYQSNIQRWPNLVYSYCKNTAVFVCPTAPFPFVPPTKAKPVSYADGSYGINQAYWAGSFIKAQTATPPSGHPLAAIYDAAGTVYLADGGGYMSFCWGDSRPRSAPQLYLNMNPPVLGSPNYTHDGTTGRYSINGRHAGGAVFTFCDGHSRWMRLEMAARTNKNGIMPIFTIEND